MATHPTAGRDLTAEEALRRLDGRLFATVTEAAAILHYDARTVRKGIGEGAIPAVRAGATYRIPTEWLRTQARLGEGKHE